MTLRSRLVPFLFILVTGVAAPAEAAFIAPSDNASLSLSGEWPAALVVSGQAPQAELGFIAVRPRIQFDAGFLAGSLRTVGGADIRVVHFDLRSLLGWDTAHVDLLARSHVGTLGFADPDTLFGFTGDGSLIGALAFGPIRAAAGPTMSLDATLFDGGRYAPGGSAGLGVSLFGIEVWAYGQAWVSFTDKTAWRPRAEAGALLMIPLPRPFRL